MHRTPISWAIGPLRRYAVFSGRSGRGEFWWFWLLIVFVNFVLTGIRSAGLPTVSVLLSLPFFVPQLSVSARRLHDIDRSAWWLTMPVAAVILVFILALELGNRDTVSGFARAIPVLLSILLVLATLTLLLVWFCRAGTVGPNRHGPDPLDPIADIVAVFS